ncbi:karilysin [Pedobacter glucosidilyticus]|nr:T9SS type A sorting domain-containing protein [Pedobacter glucosidilyticus]KHJ36918.1 karilysin [Pedobacter glucosidilyticus]
MKYLFTLILHIFLIQNTIAQEPEGETPDDYADKMRLVFQNIDPTPINTGILIDVGVEFLSMDNFSGTITLNDSNYVNTTNWRSVYGSLMSGQFNNQISFSSFTTINTAVDSAKGANQPVPFMLLNYNYYALRSDAVSAGLISVYNEQLYDVPNRPSSPYLLKTAFAIAPTEEYIIAPEGYASFIFKSELMFGNTEKTINQLMVNMDDGAGLHAVPVGTAFTANYTASGIKEINYQVTYTDNSIYTGHSKIYIDYQAEDYVPGGGSNMLFFHPIADEVVSSGNKTATLQIRLSNQNTSSIIKKPLIVVEGIDFWKISSPNDASSNYTVNTLLRNSVTGTPLFPVGNLRDSIDLLSYDIIFIDFTDATDYMQNNSALVQAAISWVNAHKQPLNGVIQQNVVLGISMGGVLARHALRTMELANTAHDTRLYISMDSPHQGANFPLSLQATVKHLNNAEFGLFWGSLPLIKFKDQFPGIDIAKRILDAPASRQLLKYRIGGSSNLGVDNVEHDSFYSSYHAMGMPENCRNIAISNGSECGLGQLFSPLTTIFEIKEEERSGLPVLINLIDAFTATYQVYAGALTNKPFIGFGSLLGIFSTKTSFYTEFFAKALPNQAYERVYRGRVGIRRRILGLFNVNSNITNRSAHSNSYMLPLDNAPGGEARFANGESLGIPSDLAQMVKTKGFCYIPTVSALDIGNGIALNTSHLLVTYSINNPTSSPYNSPFSSFVAAVRNPGALLSNSNNEDHVTFTPRNGSFILKELKGNISTPINCTFYCNSNSFIVSGPSQFCNSAIYTIPNLPSGASVSWSIEGYGVEIVSSSGNQVTVAGDYYGEFRVKANVTSTCGTIEAKSNLIVFGFPYTVGITQVSNDGMGTSWGELCSNSPNYDNYYNTLSYTVQSNISTPASYPLTLNYVFYDENGDPHGATSTSISSGTGSVNLPNLSPGFYSLQVWLSGGSCNTPGEWTEEWIEYTSCGNFARLITYPNPSNETLIISYKGDESFAKTNSLKNTASEEKHLFLFDDKGKEVKKDMMKAGETKLEWDIKNLPSGRYFLHINEGKEVIKKQIIIKH